VSMSEWNEGKKDEMIRKYCAMPLAGRLQALGKLKAELMVDAAKSPLSTCLLLMAEAEREFMLMGCNSGTSGNSIEGTWYLGVAGVDDLVFTSTTFSASGSFGTLGCSIEADDTKASHIQMIGTSAGRGPWTSGIPTGP
jgi:hypothetical protein